MPGNIGRPGIGDRPGPGDRPIIGGNRPGDRPIIGGGNNIVNRPGGDNNLVINRPGGNVNINRPNNWGWGNNNWNNNWRHGNWNNNWHDQWYGNHIHNHYHGWYHGCWAGANWYAPLAFGVSAWGYSSLAGWGLGTPYYNPYYDETASAGYDYSQPIVVNNYVTADADGGAADADATAAAPADPTLSLVDEACDLFRQSQYRDALRKLDTAARKQPGDPVIHELSALCYFALGDYRRAAAALNSLLTSAPGMDWTTMSTLYADADEYTQQLRRLETHCKSKPDDAAAAFVLAYHYLVLGETDAAINSLRVVVRNQPKDSAAKRMLEALAPPEEATKPDESPAKPAAGDETSTEAPGEQTDLVGSWSAKGGDTTIELTIDEKFEFVWKATPNGSPAVELKGQVVATSDTLVLDAKDKGTMVGQVKSAGADKFEFRLIGMPPSEPSLAFVRAR